MCVACTHYNLGSIFPIDPAGERNGRTEAASIELLHLF